MTDADDRQLQALRQGAAERKRQIQALLDRKRELERKNEALERELAAFLAKLTPHQRAVAEAELASDFAERDPAMRLN